MGLAADPPGDSENRRSASRANLTVFLANSLRAARADIFFGAILSAQNASRGARRKGLPRVFREPSVRLAGLSPNDYPPRRARSQSSGALEDVERWSLR